MKNDETGARAAIPPEPDPQSRQQPETHAVEQAGQGRGEDAGAVDAEERGREPGAQGRQPGYVRVTALPREATVNDVEWEHRAEQQEIDALSTARSAAEKWTTQIASLTGIFSIVVLVKGPEDVTKLEGDVGRLIPTDSLSVAILASLAAVALISVRPSRMIFGDGAAALVIGPAADGAPPDIEVVQAYAGGPISQVNSIIWPNPEFDNDLTVYGPEVKALVERYLDQMMGELRALDGPEGGSLLDAIDIVVPHQANKSMVAKSATAAGLDGEHLYFDVETVGNVSAASIPIAIHDAVRDGAIDHPMRVFTPAFGAGAVGGYTVIRVDPAIVVPEGAQEAELLTTPASGAGSLEDVRAAFGG